MVPILPRRLATRRGITIVEVLVVIVVLLLSAITFTSCASQLKHSSRTVTCQANLRQCHTAIMMFSEQRPSGRLPTGDWAMSVMGMALPPEGYRGDQFGVRAIDLVPYGMTEELVHCPTVPKDLRRVREGFWYYHRPSGGMNGNDYVYQGGHGNREDTPDPYGWLFRRPSGYFLTTTMTLDSNREPTPPSDVIYMSDIAYNTEDSYARFYYGHGERDHTDFSNHRAAGQQPWQAALSNRLHADGHTVTYKLDNALYGNSETTGWWAQDYYAKYW